MIGALREGKAMQGSVTCERDVRSLNAEEIVREANRQIKFWIDRGFPGVIGTTPAGFLKSIPPVGRIEEGCDRWTLPLLLVVPMSLEHFVSWRGMGVAHALKGLKDPASAKKAPYWLQFVTTMTKRNGQPLLTALELAFLTSIVTRFPPDYRIISGTPWNGGKELVTFVPAREEGGTGVLTAGSLEFVGTGKRLGNWTVAVHAGDA